MNNSKTIIISRIDSIGDVILTLPMAGAIKQVLPNSKVIFIGNNYTKSVIELCVHVDVFLNAKDLINNTNGLDLLLQQNATDIIHVFPNKKIALLAKSANIKNRIGTTNRIFHWLSCNNLIRLSRKNSSLHESQLNLKLLKGLLIKCDYNLEEIKNLYGLKLQHQSTTHVDKSKKIKVILHPKSKGSAREWGMQNFQNLIQLLDKNKYEVYVSGTIQEKFFADEICSKFNHVHNICGTMNLLQFIEFINEAEVLVACSTGPLHIASALGKIAIGLYAPMKPIFPQRWAPVGTKSYCLVIDKQCNDCKKGGECACILSLEAYKVHEIIESNF